MHDSFSRLLHVFRTRVPEEKRANREMQVLAELMEVSPQTLTNWKKRGVSKEGALTVPDRFGGSAEFVFSGLGPPFPLSRGANPVHIVEPETRSVSVATLCHAIAQACQALSERDRDVIADSVSYMVRRGPDEREMATVIGRATIDASLQLPASLGRQSATPQRVGPADIDHEVSKTLQDLAVASMTMTLPERRAMVAALQGIKETSWKSTQDSSSGRLVRPPNEEPGSQPIYRSPGGGARIERKTK